MSPEGLKARLTVPALAFGGTLTALMQTVVIPLLPDLPRLTGASASAVSWMVTATLLAGAVLTPVLGRAGDMYGKRRVLLLALGLMTTGSLVCAVTSDIRLLIAARALTGAATAVVPLSISILRDELPPARTGSAVALMSSTVGIGAALGLPLAALIVQYADWHVMFWATTGLGALGLALAWSAVRESPVRSPGRFDFTGSAGLGIGLVCLLLAISQGGDWGWTSPTVLGLSGAAVIVLAAWWLHQRRAANPLVDLRLAARPQVALPHLAALFTGFSFYANSLVTAQLLQAPEATGYGLALTVFQTGLCMLPGGLIMLFLSPVSARISAARGPKTTLASGAAVIAAGYAVRIGDSEHLWTIILGAAVISAGTTLAYSALPTLILQAVPAGQTASANGVNVLLRTVGQAICSAVVAALLIHRTAPVGGTEIPTLHGYLLAFGVAGTVALLACALALAIPSHRAIPSHHAIQSHRAAPGEPERRTEPAAAKALEGT